MKYKKIIIIPAYQPNDKLIQLINTINRKFKNDISVIVVDDGSREQYSTIFNEVSSHCIVLHHTINKGKGRALKTAFQYVIDNFKGEKYIVVTVDCDGQHSLDDVIRLLDYNVDHPNTLVLGSRKLNNKVPLRSKLGNTITRIVFFIATHVFIYDTQTGLRSFSNDLIKHMIQIKGERFEYEMNVLLYLTRLSIPIHEIDIQTIYIDNNSGSHFHTIRDSYHIYKQIFKFSWLPILSFFINILLFILFVRLFSFNIVLSYTISTLLSLLFYILNKKSRRTLSFSFYLLAFLLLIIGIFLILGIHYFNIPLLLSKLIVDFITLILYYLMCGLFINK